MEKTQLGIFLAKILINEGIAGYAAQRRRPRGVVLFGRSFPLFPEISEDQKQHQKKVNHIP